MSQFETKKVGRARNQSAVPLRMKSQNPGLSRGLLLRGVVTKTYTLDDPDHPYAASAPSAVYCDVLIYSSVKGMSFRSLPNCLVCQDRGAMHSGRIWKPRAASIDITGDTFDPEKGTDPSAMDGDHVLVGFLDDNFNMPVILGGLSHPAQDEGNKEDPEPGERMRVNQDEDPDLWKHKGVYYGVDKDGNFIIDTRFAYPGPDFNPDGTEPDPPEDGSCGSFILKMQKGTKLQLDIEDGPTFLLEFKGPDTVLTLGDGTVSVAVADHLQALWEAMKSTLDTWGGTGGHTHPTGVGPSGPPTPVLNVDAWDSNINSDHLLIPDTG